MDHRSTASRIETLAVHGGERRPGPDGSIVFPIYQGTVYTYDDGASYHDIKYIRLNTTPSQKYLHDKIAALEGAEAALATSSGMAAITTALHTLLKAGDHIIAGDTLYGGTHTFLTEHAPTLGWQVTFVDPGNPETFKPALKPNTKAMLVETITNPLMRVARHKEVVAFAKQAGITTIIDNTFASPVNFRPLALGYDLAFHSATKYLNGHSDLVAGCLVGSRAQIERVRETLNHYGGTLDPHAGFLLARGMKTLALRVRAQGANALALAKSLATHAKVAGVNYPGLETHPDHKHARELLSGFGGMLSIRLKGGVPAAERLVASLRIPTYAPSLGGVETLIVRPSLTSHAGMKREERLACGITDDLLRISCGIEASEDLVDDFKQALDKV
ncbi:MAG TPA: aminotransferase class V-fold PLP-dependent enzyme [Candidatus Polarisedimenticolia bacterium]|nr:aminotransferase class V-fold PLP-dependent enzyme [Candidatus Polarisedimenticolia bacterium]